MKSLGKLRKFALHKSDLKEKREHQAPAHLDDLAQASQDMHDMRNCYDSLLSAAAATANCAYEFSESLQEMGTCLLEKTRLHDDGESGKALLMLGKVQLELQKLVDSYRSHIILTITNPSESLLSELRKVEEMKLQSDEKREVYEYMMAQPREKERLRSGKGETFTSQQLEAAREQCDEVARLCIFRVESLKQGQCRSLLTQAARHHAAQLNFFRMGLKSLETVEPHIRLVTEKQHIDYQLSGLDYGEDVSSHEINDAVELSFDYRQNNQGLDNASTSRNSMEVDSYPRALKSEYAELNLSKNQGEQVFSQLPRVSSHSAPIFAEKFDPAERTNDIRSSPAKFNTYRLPTPADAKSATSRKSTSVIHSSPISFGGSSHNLWHSSPLETDKHGKNFTDHNFSEPTVSKAQLIFKESNVNNISAGLPPPLTDGLSLAPSDAHNAYDTKTVKRKAFSDSLASKPSSTKHSLSASAPLTSTELPQLVPGLLSRVPIPQPPLSLNVTHSASPPLASSPKIGELHELPRPPGSSTSKTVSSSGVIGHSAPLVFFRNQDISSTGKNSSLASHASSSLPPLIVPRSFSIPSSNQRTMALHVSKLLESPQILNKTDDVTSPPLTPISLSNMTSFPAVSEVASSSWQIRGGR